MAALPKHPSSPEWVTSDALPIRGLDLLGLRIPVERIGQHLLEAVTTVSPTIRYVSLRAWIARRYALARLPDSWNSFREFAARIEAAVALGNLLVDPGAAGLVGLDEGHVKIDASTGPIKLQPLVKQLAVATYAGPSNALKLSFADDEMEIPGLTAERGWLLAEAVHELVKHTEFVKKISSDPNASVFEREVLREFGAAFPIGRPEGDERKILIDCLFPAGGGSADGPFMTYRLLIELARSKQRRPRPDDVFEMAVGPDKTLLQKSFGGCLGGWLWYLLRDMIAACHEAVLEAVVDSFSFTPDQPQYANALLQRLLAQDHELESPLRDLGVLPAKKSPLDAPLSSLAALVSQATTPKHGDPARWEGKLQETSVIRTALNAGPGSPILLPLAWLLVRERVGDPSQLPPMIQDWLSYQGIWRMGVHEVILPGLEDMLHRQTSIRQAAHELTVRTVSHHLNVAWGRLRADPRRDVSLISADGERWSQHNSFRAGRTASRLPQAIGWLLQLRLVDEKGCTDDGDAVLNSVGSRPAIGVGA